VAADAEALLEFFQVLAVDTRNPHKGRCFVIQTVLPKEKMAFYSLTKTLLPRMLCDTQNNILACESGNTVVKYPYV